MRTYLLIALVYLFFDSVYAAPPSLGLQGTNLLGTTEITSDANKTTVLVFLSSICPCSNSHVEELKRLKNDFPDVEFIGVHSNADEDLVSAKEYFSEKKLNFPLIEDDTSKLANQFKALRTPHAFVINTTGETLYQGGVTSSSSFDEKNQNYLREALTDLREGKKIRTTSSRPLGCMIARAK